MHDRAAFERSRHADDSSWQIEVPEKELSDRAKKVNIVSVRAFLSSELFTAHRFTYDAGRKVIIHTI